MELVVVNTSETAILVKGTKNRRTFETLFTESPDGDVVFVLNGVVRCYTFDSTALYDYHNCIISLEAGMYKPKDSIQFILRGVRDAVCKYRTLSGGGVQLFLQSGLHTFAELKETPSTIPGGYKNGSHQSRIVATDWLDRFGGVELASSFQQACINQFNKYRL